MATESGCEECSDMESVSELDDTGGGDSYVHTSMESFGSEYDPRLAKIQFF
jgi:hypothetical protein